MLLLAFLPAQLRIYQVFYSIKTIYYDDTSYMLADLNLRLNLHPQFFYNMLKTCLHYFVLLFYLLLSQFEHVEQQDPFPKSEIKSKENS